METECSWIYTSIQRQNFILGELQTLKLKVHLKSFEMKLEDAFLILK